MAKEMKTIEQKKEELISIILKEVKENYDVNLHYKNDNYKGVFVITDALLSHVILWYNTNGRNNGTQLVLMSDWLYFVDNNNRNMHWDLSRCFLSEQSDSIIEFLYSLI
jgi:hypothetical protein